MFRIILSSIFFLYVSLCFASAYLHTTYEIIEDVRNKGEGESCQQNGKLGECTRASVCRKSYPGNWWQLEICGFVDNELNAESVVCCPIVTTTTTTTTTPKPVATTPPMGPVTEHVPETPEYELNPMYVDTRLGPDGCIPMKSNISSNAADRKAGKKCMEYQVKLVYPCEESKALGGDKVRGSHCHHNAEGLIIGGVDCNRAEFPHMVLLGYGRIGPATDSAIWKCGGTLISDRFILTAAHCTRVNRIPVTYAIVGSHKRTDEVKSSQVHSIKRIVKHPDFNASTLHNDIALLETADLIHLTHETVPACLDVFDDDNTRAVATGWGATAFQGAHANTLQKVTLKKFTDNECSAKYPENSDEATFNSTIQICYGDHDDSRDACQGDSGGPLTVFNKPLHCMYTVVGVTSFGINCGDPGVPGWYTKVAHYVPWIESIVWP